MRKHCLKGAWKELGAVTKIDTQTSTVITFAENIEISVVSVDTSHSKLTSQMGDLLRKVVNKQNKEQTKGANLIHYDKLCLTRKAARFYSISNTGVN